MQARRSVKVLWVYDRDSRAHPFIRIGAESLRAAGVEVEIVDGGSRADSVEGIISPYDRQWFIDRSNAAKDWVNGPLKRMEGDLWAKQTRIRKEQRKLQAQLGSRRFRRWRAYSLAIQARQVLARHKLAVQTRAWLRRLINLRRETLHFWMTYLRGAYWVAKRRSDVIIASRPHVLLPCWIIARLSGRRLVYYPFELYGYQKAPYTRIIGAWEKLCLRLGVDALLTQNPERAKIYRNKGFAGKFTILPNKKRLADRPKERLLRKKLDVPPDTRIVLYEGVLIPGRWLDRLAEASLLLPDDAVMVFMGKPSSWFQQHAPAFLAGPVAAGKLHVLDPVPHEEVLAHVADANLGFIIYDDSALNNIYCAPGKLSDYVLAGVPVIAPCYPTIERDIIELGIGVCFDDPSPSHIAAAMNSMLKQPAERWRAALERARYAVSWQSQEDLFVRTVLGRLAGAPSSAAAGPALSPSDG